MKRQICTVELPEGAWVGLRCGHPNPSTGQHGGCVECRLCDLRRIPPTTRPGRQTAVFDSTTVPAALLRAHQTTTWAELIVISGCVEFYDEDPHWRDMATPDHRVVIVPHRLHHIEPAAGAQFYVQFHDLPKCKADSSGLGS